MSMPFLPVRCGMAGASCASSPMSRRSCRAPLACGRAISRISRAASCPAWPHLSVNPGRANPGFMTKWASPVGGAVAYDEMMLSLHDAAKRDSNFQHDSAASGNPLPARVMLAGLTDHGAACRAGRRIRPGTDFPSGCGRIGRTGTSADPGIGAARRPLPFIAREIFRSEQEQGAVHSASVWTAKTPVSDVRRTRKAKGPR